MDAADLPSRLMDNAQRYDPPVRSRSVLEPYRDVLLLCRAKSMSYEQIAKTLTNRGLKVSPAGVGVFCRRSFTKGENVRELRRFESERMHAAAATPGDAFPSMVAKPAVPPMMPARRGPRIARDNY